MRWLQTATFICFVTAFNGGPASAAQLELPEIPYGTGTWDPETLGNQRVVLEVGAAADATLAHIPWRRRDAAPETKNVIIVEGSTGATLTNVVLASINQAYGDIVFQAQKPGTYYAYYLPKISRGRNYPTSSYRPPENTADNAWKSKNGLASAEQVTATLNKLPQAKVVEMQAINDFNSFYPMEVAATTGETRQLESAHAGESFLLFPEDRMLPIRMTDQLPAKWIKTGPQSEFTGQMAPNEFYAFQIGVYALSSLKDVTVQFGQLESAENHQVIPASELRCINTGGTNWTGKAFTKSVSVPKGQVQALWCGVQVPKNCAPGKYEGVVTIQAAGCPSQQVHLALTVAGAPLADHGDSKPSQQSRLRWLDSTLAQDDDVIRPYTPIKVAGNTLSLLGRQLTLDDSGLPGQITSYFSPENTTIESTGKPLLESPIQFVAQDDHGQAMTWNAGKCQFTKQSDGTVEWTANSTAGSLKLEVTGRLEFDGSVQYQATVTSTEAIDLNDFQLQFPVARDRARYFMGLGLQGQLCPDTYDWTWDITKHQDSAWLGDADGGVQFKLRGENYEPPLLTNFYKDEPLHMPPAWFNNGHGGITLRRSDKAVVVSCNGGKRRLEAGQKLHFDFNLLLTPFRTINPRTQWSTRFFHSYQPVEVAQKLGANVINIHHATEINPYINYPFLRVPILSNYIAEAHAKDIKVKIYYTIRELSNHAAELYAMRSLGDEIYPDGKGGGDAWLLEHIGSHYMPGWFVASVSDAALIDKGSTRWDNYYVEGLSWMIKNANIDGLYIDDLAYDRITMQRVRKVLDREHPGALIDFHSANQFDPNDGFGSCANVYMEQLPYIDRLWFGEYFSPDSPPDFWLIEMSGIPFGLMGEMLQDGGNRWRGMLYGMTSRMSYQGNDPSPIWHIWDQFKIQDSQMYGYWSPRCPVKTDSTNILATAYVGKGKTLVSIASWAPNDAQVKLTFDWKALGIDPDKAELIAPEISEFQPAAKFKPVDPILVPKGKGWLLYISTEP